jgi:hypothetical protein
MKVLLKAQQLILVPESDAETSALAEWKAGHAGHVLVVGERQGSGVCLGDLGPRAEACREPVVIWSKSPDLAAQQIGNFAPTPFELDGQRYASVESFWQSLKFQEPADRLRVASLEGAEAKRAGTSQGYGATVMYEGQTILVGTWAHWNLMERACRAKFAQNQAARAALLGTGQRPLVHRVRQDSQTIPAVILAEIWMRIRKEFFDEASGA